MKAAFRRWRRLGVLAAALACFAILTTPGAFGQGDVGDGDAEVTVGSNDLEFSQNKQNEPAIAVDANHPNVLAAGANDNIDMELCNAGDDTTCPFTAGVGVSGIAFSSDEGHTWHQPTYTGYSARGCLGVPDTSTDSCTPNPNGPIGTLPWYYENGLVSNGDPALAFGPVPENGTFDWDNGSRLYYANLTANFPAAKRDETFRGPVAIGVSRTDNVAAAAAGGVAGKNAWMPPVIASKQSSTTFSDKEQIWADNASSSRFFGNVYICYAQFRSNSAHQNANAPVPLIVVVSRDGGDTWTSKKLTPAGTSPNSNNANRFGISGCSIRTDSSGVVYLFGERFAPPFELPTVSEHVLFKSFDGGKSWTKPLSVQQVTDPCFVVDPVIGRCVEDGIAGARNDLAAAPSVDIANGAPDGAGATNEIVDAWADGRDGLNREHVMVSYSTNGGGTWSAPVAIENPPATTLPGDRGYYAAPAISPNGTDVYVVYNAFTTPFRQSAVGPAGDRQLVGVVRHADADVVDGALTAWTDVHRGAPGDPRGSSQNNLQAEFLGDYVYAIATRTYGAAVWNDTRETVDCPDMDAWRQSLRDGTTVPQPAPQQDCDPTWGNSDIFAWSGAAP
jgi:hypothetical protein